MLLRIDDICSSSKPKNSACSEALNSGQLDDVDSLGQFDDQRLRIFVLLKFWATSAALEFLREDCLTERTFKKSCAFVTEVCQWWRQRK